MLTVVCRQFVTSNGEVKVIDLQRYAGRLLVSFLKFFQGLWLFTLHLRIKSHLHMYMYERKANFHVRAMMMMVVVMMMMMVVVMMMTTMTMMAVTMEAGEC